MNETRGWVPAALLALGLLGGGMMIGRGFTESRLGDRFVTVKGVAEREVEADLAVWTIQLSAGGNDLAEVQRTIERNEQLTLEFLQEHGISPDLAQTEGLRVVDAAANPYQQGPVVNRFAVTQTIVVRSEDPRAVQAAAQDIGTLVERGVVLVSGQEWGPGGPTFLWRGLNEVKPEMIAEATARAREAAVEFARDSDARLGGIRRANQGVFEILPRDPAPNVTEQNRIEKTVRVVSTIEYYLQD
ncbi:MAG TPA: SIMPL domain-containing protein [Longimicrobiales bacterium]|nr:SIMPL domain-containing protein [Longimicrobiales bacterium]